MLTLINPLFRSFAKRTTGLGIFLILFVPMAAHAAPVTYSFTSGSAVIRASLAGESDSILLGTSAVEIPLVNIQAVIDPDLGGGFGRLESFEVVGSDFSVSLNSSLVSLSQLDVSAPTITSLSGSDLNLFGQFALETTVTAQIGGAFPSGATFGPVDVTSTINSGTAAGMLFSSQDQVMIQVLGVSLARFEQFGHPDPNAPDLELKVDFSFQAKAVTAIPEPSAAIVFAVGMLAAGTSIRRSRG
jgi:hypothetical protein